MSLARDLFKLASVVNTLTILASGNPTRIGRHLTRKYAYKRISRVGRGRRGK